MANYFRGQIAKAANLNIETLRYYERNGLISVPDRTSKGYRIYETAVLDRLEFIKYAKGVGFTLMEIRHLLSILDSKNVDLDYVSGLLDKKTEEIGRKISDYMGMMEFLQKVKGNLHNPDRCSVLQRFMKDVQCKNPES